MKSPFFVILVLAASTAGCMAQVGAAATAGVPRDAATTCASYCTDMQMTLSAVVVMANNDEDRGPRGQGRRERRRDGGDPGRGGRAAPARQQPDVAPLT
jgi:hypothetical protein